MSAVPARNPESSSGKPPHHQEAFLASFIKATQETLAVQCAVKVTAGSPIAKDTNEEEGAEIVVIGGIVGKGIDCSVAFCFSEPACALLIGAMFQKKVKLDRGQVMEATSEMVRIIGFQATKLLNARGYEVEAVFPRIVLDGKKVRLWADKMRDGIVLPFHTPRGDKFTVEIL